MLQSWENAAFIDGISQENPDNDPNQSKSHAGENGMQSSRSYSVPNINSPSTNFSSIKFA